MISNRIRAGRLNKRRVDRCGGMYIERRALDVLGQSLNHTSGTVLVFIFRCMAVGYISTLLGEDAAVL